MTYQLTAPIAIDRQLPKRLMQQAKHSAQYKRCPSTNNPAITKPPQACNHEIPQACNPESPGEPQN
ncbi:MAG: hypothetical protein FWD57_02385 [Polyangiaceae bacterium]|nr:hypothetical protein [Polyangiaceae bacterium]